jgi:hypothetical protein
MNSELQTGTQATEATPPGTRPAVLCGLKRVVHGLRQLLPGYRDA